MIRKVFFSFLLFKLITLVFAYLATFFIPLTLKFTAATDFGLRLPYFVWIWGNFDGTHYMEIARNGYHPNENAFFPLFPFLIKALFLAFGTITYIPYLITAQFISNLSLLASLFIIGKIIMIDTKDKLLNLLYLIIILFPTSFFYTAVYNDSLFLLFASLTIYFARKKNWIVSGIAAGLATLTRANGLALIFVILFEYLTATVKNDLKTYDFKKILLTFSNITIQKLIRSKIYAIVLVPLSFVGYLAYTHLAHGNWVYVFSSLQTWNQNKLTFPLQVFWRYLKILVSPTLQLTYFIALLEILFVLLYILLLVYSYRKIRLSYWAFFAASILIPSLTGTFQGMPRYGLHLYPFFLVLTLFLSQRGTVVKTIYFILSILLMLFTISLFTRGYFVA